MVGLVISGKYAMVLTICFTTLCYTNSGKVRNKGSSFVRPI